MHSMILNFSLTLIQPIRYTIEHGRRTRIRDPENSTVPVTVDFIVQIVFVHEHQSTTRRWPLRFLYVNLFAIIHCFGGSHKWYAISVENAKKKTPLLRREKRSRWVEGHCGESVHSPTYWVDTSKTWYLASRVFV